MTSNDLGVYPDGTQVGLHPTEVGGGRPCGVRGLVVLVVSLHGGISYTLIIPMFEEFSRNVIQYCIQNRMKKKNDFLRSTIFIRRIKLI